MNSLAPIGTVDKQLLAKLDSDGRMNLTACLQCARCSSGCTMRHEMDNLPHQLNRMVLLGLEEEVVASKAVWVCVSCQTCFARCPMGVNTAAMIDRLRAMAKNAPDRDLERVRIFNRLFLTLVRHLGRVYEMGLMVMYKVSTGDVLRDLDKMPMMLRKRKIALLPKIGCMRRAVSRIFSEACRRSKP